MGDICQENEPSLMPLCEQGPEASAKVVEVLAERGRRLGELHLMYIDQVLRHWYKEENVPGSDSNKQK